MIVREPHARSVPSATSKRHALKDPKGNDNRMGGGFLPDEWKYRTTISVPTARSAIPTRNHFKYTRGNVGMAVLSRWFLGIPRQKYSSELTHNEFKQRPAPRKEMREATEATSTTPGYHASVDTGFVQNATRKISPPYVQTANRHYTYRHPTIY